MYVNISYMECLGIYIIYIYKYTKHVYSGTHVETDTHTHTHVFFLTSLLFKEPILQFQVAMHNAQTLRG